MGGGEMIGKAVVTGATGFIGSHLTAELLDRSISTTIIIRESSSLSRLSDLLAQRGHNISDVTIATAELTDEEALAEIFRGYDTVFHCAATVSFDPKRDQEIITGNTDITMSVVEASIAANVRLIHTSSIAALGSAKYPEFVTEQTVFESVEDASGYSISKFYSENEVWRGIHEGLQAIIVNPSVVIGRGGEFSQLIGMVKGGMPFYTEGITGYVDVRDVCRAMAMLAEKDTGWGERYILSAENLSYKELFEKIAAYAGIKPPKYRVGRPAISIGRHLINALSRLSGKKAVITKNIARTAIKKLCYDGSKITGHLEDFRYTPIDRSIEEVLTDSN